MSEYKPNWIRQLEIQSNIAKSIIVDGNINDLHYVDHTFMTVVQKIYSVIEESGFDDVLYWDRETKQAQSYKNNSDIVNSISGDILQKNKDEGDEYDIGDTTSNTNNEIKEQNFKDAKEFFNFILKRLNTDNNENKIAFVVDWSDSIFGNITNLDNDDRENLMLLEKSIRNSPVSLDNTGNNDIVILITNSASTIPPSYYQNNQSVSLVNIPKPNRKDREVVINSICGDFEFEDMVFPDTPEIDILNDSLDHMTIRDIVQLVKLSKLDSSKMTMKKLISLYRYGDDKSPWEDLSKDRIDNLEEELKQNVMGQDHVIHKIYSMVVKAYMGLSGLQHSTKQQTPKGTLFFVGPTGVGKTELAKSLARFLFGDEESYLRFDMSEYNHENSDQRLVGAPPGYVGYEEGGQLTNAVRTKPFSVLLFDEIEKAHPRILDKFLQILEDGRLTDGQGKTTYFTETVIIFTSNIGAAQIDSNLSSDETHLKFKEQVQEHFKVKIGRPELLNRINTENIIPFNFIKDKNILNLILQAKLKNLKERLKEKYNILDIEFENESIIEILTNEHDDTSGGRGLLNLLNTMIIEPLSEHLYNCNDKSEYNNKSIIIQQFGNTNAFKFEFR